MKKQIKTIIILLLVSLVILILGMIISFKNIKKISKEEAENIVLKDIGRNLSDVTYINSKLDREDRKIIYEIEVMIDQIEYEYEIDAQNGDILKREVKQKENNNSNNIPNTNETNLISLNQAKEIALKDANVNNIDITFVKEKLEYEDGIGVYEIEFYDKETEYEYEINAQSGMIIKKEWKQRPEIETSLNLSMENAKEIAFQDSGVINPTLVKEKVEQEHGTQIYEIEFYENGMEYEYKIDGSTGAILKSSKESKK